MRRCNSQTVPIRNVILRRKRQRTGIFCSRVCWQYPSAQECRKCIEHLRPRRRGDSFGRHHYERGDNLQGTWKSSITLPASGIWRYTIDGHTPLSNVNKKTTASSRKVFAAAHGGATQR